MPLLKKHNDNVKVPVVLLVLLLLILMGSITYYAVQDAYNKVLEYQALSVAEIVAHQAAVSRSVYAREVVSKLNKDGFGGHIDYQQHTGFVPLPAQFLKMMGQAVNSDGSELYRFRPLSKWNLEPTQGLNDDFQRWAWSELERQDQESPLNPIDWQAAWRYEKVQGVNTLRYLQADPAAADSCISCHNAFEKTAAIRERRKKQGLITGRQWQLHQLLGAIEVLIPLDKVDALISRQTRRALGMILVVLATALLALGWFLLRNVRFSKNISHISWMATHDTLTNVMNRRGFDMRLKDLLESAANYNKHHVLAYIDVDHFKNINDTHGHVTGDYVLKEISNILLSHIREGDTVARIGGDEFALLLENCPLQRGQQTVKKISRAIAEHPFINNNSNFNLNVSIGLVGLDTTTIKHDRYFEWADMALYAAKNAGRNQVYAYDPQTGTAASA